MSFQKKKNPRDSHTRKFILFKCQLYDFSVFFQGYAAPIPTVSFGPAPREAPHLAAIIPTSSLPPSPGNRQSAPLLDLPKIQAFEITLC